MSFRTRAASIDANHHKGIIVQNANGTGGLLVPTGRSLTDAIPIDVSVVNSNGDQITSFGSQVTSGTSVQSTVASSASNVTLLAANSSRTGATIVNDSTAVVYVKLGTTASTSSYTIALGGSGAAPFTYYEVPFGYTGKIDAIWASANGNARMTEFSA